VLIVCGASLAQAQAPSDDAQLEQRARAYFTLGLGHFNLGDYDAAIADFQAGYALKPMPRFLYNIAQTANKAGKFELAVEYYQRYVAEELVRTAGELEQARHQLDELRRKPPPQPPVAAVWRAPPAVAIAAPPPRKPVWKRGWFWGALAGVAAGAAVAIGVGVGARPTGPRASLGAVSF
jgi:tetratricopeptide (TPR) repeat protein